jgi:RNA polymerase sigma-70 factor (ECF subfamily)
MQLLQRGGVPSSEHHPADSGAPAVSSEQGDEAALIERAKSDPGGFGELYERYVDRIYNYIYHRVGSHYDAEDLAARTFQRALEHIARYEDRGAPFSAWLYRIAHNLVANWHRDRSRRRRRVVSLGEMLERHPRQDGLARVGEASEEQAALRVAIRRLPADRQLLLVLKFSEELPNAQIGKIMGRSEGAIKSLYHRTLIALRKDLEGRGFWR